MVKEIAEAIKNLFSFLKAERDPEKQIGRLHQKEYAILKKAVKYAVLIFQWEKRIEAEKDIKKIRYGNRVIKIYKDKFWRLLAEE